MLSLRRRSAFSIFASLLGVLDHASAADTDPSPPPAASASLFGERTEVTVGVALIDAARCCRQRRPPGRSAAHQ